MNRLTENYKSGACIPLRNAICRVDMPRWKIVDVIPNVRLLTGDAADRLSAFEDLNLEPSEILALKQEVERLKAERRWIPVTERLPEYSCDYFIVSLQSGAVWPARCYGKGEFTPIMSNFHGEFSKENPVTHWMKFPEPPKEEGKE
jgi:hypothetical protein